MGSWHFLGESIVLSNPSDSANSSIRELTDLVNPLLWSSKLLRSMERVLVTLSPRSTSLD